MCLFGSQGRASHAARFISSTEIICVSPGSASPGPVTLYLKPAGKHSSTLYKAGQFTFTERIVVDSVSPRIFPEIGNVNLAIVVKILCIRTT